MCWCTVLLVSDSLYATTPVKPSPVNQVATSCCRCYEIERHDDSVKSSRTVCERKSSSHTLLVSETNDRRSPCSIRGSTTYGRSPSIVIANKVNTFGWLKSAIMTASIRNSTLSLTLSLSTRQKENYRHFLLSSENL